MISTVIFLFVITFFLLLPVELVFKVSNLENQNSIINVKLFFGLVQFRLFPGKKKLKPDTIKSSKGRSKFTFAKFLKLATNELFVNKTVIFLKRIFSSIKLKLEKLYINLGLDDPADTGILWGLIGPASALFDYYAESKVVVEPDFQETKLNIDTKGNLSIIPLEIIFISLVFLLSPITVKTLWTNFAGEAE